MLVFCEFSMRFHYDSIFQLVGLKMFKHFSIHFNSHKLNKTQPKHTISNHHGIHKVPLKVMYNIGCDVNKVAKNTTILSVKHVNFHSEIICCSEAKCVL
jgi:hypothetical protein